MVTDSNLHNREFLGQGLAYPLQTNQRGEIALARGNADIKQAIRIILETSPGERVMRPEFGCRAKELLFAPRDATTQGLMAYHVRRALRRWEPRIEVLTIDVSIDPDRDGVLLVKITYKIKTTHDERSIVYPFYLMGEEE